MQAAARPAPVSKARLWTGSIVSAIPVLFLFVDGAMKLVKPALVVETTVRLGYSESVIVPLGILLLTSVVAYVIPRTSVLGAILLTGYLGGAVATHVRVGEEVFPIFFPVVVGVLLWGGLVLRDARLRALLPLRSPLEQSPRGVLP
jgi:hypothetical protein